MDLTKSPPRWALDAIATPLGWVDKRTNELLVSNKHIDSALFPKEVVVAEDNPQELMLDVLNNMNKLLDVPQTIKDEPVIEPKVKKVLKPVKKLPPKPPKEK